MEIRPENQSASQKTIEAVVEVTLIDGFVPWKVSKSPNAYIKLSEIISGVDIGLILFTVFHYNGISLTTSASQSLENFLQTKTFVLPGGLRFIENQMVKIVPGCCLGLEDWQQWLLVPDGEFGIWTGHDPAPFVEANGQTIRV